MPTLPTAIDKSGDRAKAKWKERVSNPSLSAQIIEKTKRTKSQITAPLAGLTRCRKFESACANTRNRVSFERTLGNRREMLDRKKALELLKKHIGSPQIIRHCLASEAIMRALARRMGADEELWGLTGLLHDLDYEEVQGDPKRHAVVGAEILRREGYPEELVRAVLAHNGDELGIPCRAPIDYAICAGETISGMIFATALVLPSKSVADVQVKSVMKRLKEKRFAANISRERVSQYQGLGLGLEDFLGIAIEALKNARLE
jgi:putative nucleotidyltransferase with HDIG domain